MKYLYSVVRYVPDTARGEFINVGAVAVSSVTGEGGVRQVDNPARARRLSSGPTLRAVWAYLDYLSGLLESNSDAEWLFKVWGDANNVVQLTEPAPISAESPDEALDILFDLYIVDPARRTRAVTKWAAYSAMRSAYIQAEIRTGETLFERVVARCGSQEANFDFAVANGHLVQMTSAWSFQSQDPDDVAASVKAWAYTVRLLQESGGQLVTKDANKEYAIPKDVGLGAVVVPPTESAGNRPYMQSLDVFSRLDVQPRDYLHVSELAALASSALSV